MESFSGTKGLPSYNTTVAPMERPPLRLESAVWKQTIDD